MKNLIFCLKDSMLLFFLLKYLMPWNFETSGPRWHYFVTFFSNSVWLILCTLQKLISTWNSLLKILEIEPPCVESWICCSLYSFSLALSPSPSPLTLSLSLSYSLSYSLSLSYAFILYCNLMIIQKYRFLSLSLSAISFDFGDHAVPQPSAPSLLY